MPIRVLLVENQELVRLGIRAVLEGESDMELAAEAASGAEGLERFRAVIPDVVILSLRLPDSCAVDDLDEYLAGGNGANIIVLAEHSGDAEIARSIKKGALGYIGKDVSPGELVRAIRLVAAGKKFIPEHIAAILTENLGAEELTNAEQRILEMLVGGMSNKEMGFALDVSENTVKTHVKNIFGKLGVSDRTSATTTAIRRGLVRIDV
ncbi:MAG: response regulator transcription factor [Acidobacteriota bacterium]|nr:MAG: response regulator transcription factor [Acidobacteriota bacterium]